MERGPGVNRIRVRPERESGLIVRLAVTAAGLHNFQNRQDDPEQQHPKGDLPVGWLHIPSFPYPSPRPQAPGTTRPYARRFTADSKALRRPSPRCVW